jgi:plasmid stabilization system protein ParE
MVEKNYKVRLLPLFEWDLSEITDYIAYNLNNPQAANLLVDEVEKAIRERLVCPESFESFPSIRDRKHQYYRIYVKNYVIYYVIIDHIDNLKIMEVRRILYNKRDKRNLI